VDTELVLEAGRYNTGMSDDHADPSRTSVDLIGDVFVGNRADKTGSPPSSVTKIAGSLDRCVDRNMDGDIDTSTYGPNVVPNILARDGAGESTDECVLWTRDFDITGGEYPCEGLRGVAATAETGDDFEYNGHVWLGCEGGDKANPGTIYKLNGDTGEIIEAFTSYIDDVRPYGFVLDKEERLWISTKNSDDNAGVQWLDTSVDTTGEVTHVGGEKPYGIAIDADGHVWTSIDAGGVQRYRPDDDAYTTLSLATKFKGIAVDADGFVWGIAKDGDAAIVLIDPGPAPGSESVLATFSLATDEGTPRKGTGVAIDFNGHVWGVSGSGCSNPDDSEDPTDYGCVTRLKMDRSGPVPVLDTSGDDIGDAGVTDRSVVNVTVGEGCYSYSDMIGFNLRTFASKEGWYRQTFEVCDNKSTSWEQIIWEANIPAGTRIAIRARTADQTADLAEAAWVTVVRDPSDTTPKSLPPSLPEGHFIELEVHLYASDDGVSPAVGDIGFTFECTSDIVIVIE
jgi:hypothetical protein